jgi:hypothetical protein
MSATLGAALQLKNTAEFIDGAPTDLELKRPSPANQKSWDPSGSQTLPSQRVRLVELGGPNYQNNTPDTWAVSQIQIVGMPDLDIRHKDFWVSTEGRWEVTMIHKANGYETRAEAVLRLAVE